jgi:hypothetical protein
MKRRVRHQQPNQFVGIDRGNPLTRGMSFAAYPVGRNFFDAVTRTFGVASNIVNTNPSQIRPNAGGKSRQAWASTLYPGSSIANYFEWPISTTLRGAGMVQQGTILALGATATQTDAKVYYFGGNTEAVSLGDGAALGIDSFLSIGRGNIIAANWNGAKNTSAAQLLGNPFDNRLHCFGFAFSGNGTDGDYFAEGKATAWSSGATMGTTTTNRRARVWSVGNNSVAGGLAESYIALLAFWDRRLTPDEYADFYANPWQVLQPIVRRSRVRLPVSAIPTLSAATVTAITATTATPRVTITF